MKLRPPLSPSLRYGHLGGDADETLKGMEARLEKNPNDTRRRQLTRSELYKAYHDACRDYDASEASAAAAAAVTAAEDAMAAGATGAERQKEAALAQQAAADGVKAAEDAAAAALRAMEAFDAFLKSKGISDDSDANEVLQWVPDALVVRLWPSRVQGDLGLDAEGGCVARCDVVIFRRLRLPRQTTADCSHQHTPTNSLPSLPGTSRSTSSTATAARTSSRRTSS